MDNGGMVRTKMVRDRVPIAVAQQAEASDRWFWWKFTVVAALVFAAISYRSYKVTVGFDYNARKLHTFYRHLNKTINPVGEARVLVYEYQDKEHLLWEKVSLRVRG